MRSATVLTTLAPSLEQGHGKVVKWGFDLLFRTVCDVPSVSAGGGQGPGGTMEVPTLTIFCHEGLPPADDIFLHSGCPQPVPSRSARPGP